MRQRKHSSWSCTGQLAPGRVSDVAARSRVHFTSSRICDAPLPPPLPGPGPRTRDAQCPGVSPFRLSCIIDQITRTQSLTALYIIEVRARALKYEDHLSVSRFRFSFTKLARAFHSRTHDQSHGARSYAAACGPCRHGHSLMLRHCTSLSRQCRARVCAGSQSSQRAHGVRPARRKPLLRAPERITVSHGVRTSVPLPLGTAGILPLR